MSDSATYPGKFQGVVSDNKDPKMRNRIRAKIPELFMNPETRECIDSDWCEGTGSWGNGLGVSMVPPVGAPVWITPRYSDDGELWQLVYEPGRHGASDGTSHVPAIARGEDDETVGPLRSSAPFKVPAADSMLGVRGTARAEKLTDDVIPGIPGSANAGEYPANSVLKMPGGTTLEFDDTEGVERVFLYHPSGTCLEINGKGVWVQRETKRWEEIVDSRTTRVGTDDRLRVDGNLQVGVGKNHVEKAAGRRVICAGELNIQSRLQTLFEVGSNFRLRVRGNTVQRFLADLNLSVGGAFTFSSTGGAAFLSGGDLQLASLTGGVHMLTAQGVDVVSPLGMRVGITPIPVATEALLSLTHVVPLIALLETVLVMLANHTHPAEPVPDPITQVPMIVQSPSLSTLLLAAQAFMPALPTVSLFAE